MKDPAQERCPFAPARPDGQQARRVRSTALLGSERRLIIEHAGESYCLRLTRNQRLILTKI